MAKRREVDADEAARWEELRNEARRHLEEVLSAGPDPDEDLMGAIAWRGAFPEPDPIDPELRDWINEAIDRRMSWREIAVALGLGESRSAESKASNRQVTRNSHP